VDKLENNTGTHKTQFSKASKLYQQPEAALTSYCKYFGEIIGQGEASQIVVDGRYRETLSSTKEAG
jgi:hypothetical protein